MDRIQHPSATSTHQFTEGDPGSGVPATTVTATWLNGLQEELVHLIEAAGIVPSASVLTQVKAALDDLYSGGTEVAALAADLAAEVTNRTNADATLVADFTDALAVVAANLANETATRSTADTNLSGMISAETTARTNADSAEASARIAGDATEATARDNADVAEVAARTSADAALSASLALQQTTVRTFSSLMELFPQAVPTNPGDIIGQNRLVQTKRADGKVLFGTLEFSWGATFANSGSCGWAIGPAIGALAPEIEAGLRELWGIGPSDEWLHPYIFGDLYIGVTRYLMAIYHQPGGASYSISGSPNGSTVYAFGRVSMHIPGVNL